MASLAINLNPNKYDVSIIFDGDDGYSSAMKNFTLTIPKVNTNISVSSLSVVRGKYFYAYLKDQNNNALKGKTVKISISKSTYTKTTDSNGRVSLKINLKVGTYSTKVTFAGDKVYSASSLSANIKSITQKTVITIPDTTIVRGKCIYFYLKDSDGNALSGQTIKIKFDNTYFTRKTNANGKAGLQIQTRLGKIPVTATYAGSTSYASSSKSVTITSITKKTVITIPDTTIVRGKCIYFYLKDSDGNALSGQTIKIKFDNTYFTRKTNANGKAGLQIQTRLGKIPVTATYAGSTSYASSSKSVTITSVVDKSQITIPDSTITRGKYFYAYLKDSSGKGISSQKVTIKFSSKSYTKTTDSNGRVALFISANPGSYATTVSFATTSSYYASSKSTTVKVLANTTAKIIAKDQTVIGEYSVRLTDNNGNPLANQTISITTTTFNRSTGSGDKISQKTIILDSDNIYNKATDLKFLNDIAAVLKSKGYKVIVNSNIGPNEHCSDVMGKYSNACIFCIFGGVDSGMFVDMSASWYQNYLKKYGNRVVLGFTYTTYNLATLTWLQRAHDDDYSPANFTGLAYPGTYLNDHGMDYVYGSTATQMANNFINYAIKGLSIGLNNTIPCKVKTYNVVTNSNGYATITDLPAGTYTVVSSLSKDSGYIADTVATQVTVK